MKILIVEDDILLACMLEDELLEQGHQVCGAARGVSTAVDLVRRHRPDLALIDMRLGQDETGSTVADRLAASGDLGRLGILYVTGGERLGSSARLGHAYLRKPYGSEALAAAIAIVRDLAMRGSTCRRLPPGMTLIVAPAVPEIAADGV